MKYVKISMVLLLLTVLNLPMAAQTEGGLKLGANFSRLHYRDGNRMYVLDSKPGLVLGGYLHFPLQNNLGIVTELAFSQMGTRNVSANYQTTLNYIAIPVLLRFKAADIFHLDGGFHLGLLASAKEKSNGVIFDVQNAYHGTDVGFNIGMGFSMPSGIGFDLRFIQGLTNIDNQFNRYDFVERNRTVQATLSYRLM